jgi:hypothetical protein
MKKKLSDKKQLSLLKQTYEKFRADVAELSKNLIERNPRSIASLPVKQTVEAVNGVQTEQPTGIMVVELMTMVKMAHMNGKQVVLRPNYNNTCVDVYVEDALPYPSDMMCDPSLQYSVEVKRPK